MHNLALERTTSCPLNSTLDRMNTMSLADQRLPLHQAVPRYWRHLLGVILFPPVGLASTKLIQLPPNLWSRLVAVLFFVSIAPVVWLLSAKKVRYSFWLATIGIYFSAGILTSIVYQIVRALST